MEVETIFHFCCEYKEILGGIFAVLLLLFWMRRWRKNRQPISATATETGEVFISRSAILNFIQSTCATIPDGYVKRIRIKNKRRLLLIRLQIILHAGYSFEASSVRFQETVKTAVTHCLGALKNIRVDVILDGIEEVSGNERQTKQDNL